MLKNGLASKNESLNVVAVTVILVKLWNVFFLRNYKDYKLVQLRCSIMTDSLTAVAAILVNHE